MQIEYTQSYGRPARYRRSTTLFVRNGSAIQQSILSPDINGFVLRQNAARVFGNDGQTFGTLPSHLRLQPILGIVEADMAV